MTKQTETANNNTLVMDENPNYLPMVLPNIEDQAAALMKAFTSDNKLAFFSTIANDGNRGTQIQIYNAISEAEQLSEQTNVVFGLTNYMAHPVTLQDEETGEIQPGLRLILLSEDGTAYACVSSGIQNSLERIVGIFGAAPWNDQPIYVKAVSKATRNGNNKVLTLIAVSPEEAKKK